jgi:hypothetical protein
MKGYYLATNLLATASTLGLFAYVIWGPMPWWVALGGAFAVNLVASSYTRTEHPPTDVRSGPHDGPQDPQAP